MKRRTYMEYRVWEFNRELSELPAGLSTCSALTDNDLLNWISWVKGPDESQWTTCLVRVFFFFGELTLCWTNLILTQGDRADFCCFLCKWVEAAGGCFWLGHSSLTLLAGLCTNLPTSIWCLDCLVFHVTLDQIHRGTHTLITVTLQKCKLMLDYVMGDFYPMFPPIDQDLSVKTMGYQII